MALAEKISARPILVNDYEFMTYRSARGRVVMPCEDPPIYIVRVGDVVVRYPDYADPKLDPKDGEYE